MATTPLDSTLGRQCRSGQDGADIQVPLEVIGQVIRTGIAVLGEFRQAFQADRIEIAGDSRATAAGSDRIVGDDPSKRLELALAAERRTPGQQLVQDRPQAIDVGRRADPLFV